MIDREELDRRHFGEVVRSLRGYAGLSRRELARRAGLPLSRVARLEDGKAALSDDTRARLERVIGCPLYFGKHQQVVVEVGDRKAEVDVGIAPLIRELWVAGIDTYLSCQQNTLGRIWIDFCSVEEMVSFLNVVARYEDGDDDLYWRMNLRFRRSGHLPNWEYSIHELDFALHEETDSGSVVCSYDPPADFHFTASVRFPPQDLPVVLQRLKEHNSMNLGTSEEKPR
jgi:transcriptional regulator with XRE-family HTH domain